jgi:hypothetical protein
MIRVQDPISRRSFFYFLIAGVIAFVLLSFRRIDPASSVLEYFGLEKELLPVIQKRFGYLLRAQPDLYRYSDSFFSLRTLRAENLLPQKLREQVLSSWISFLFRQRAISWPYVNYPSVGEYRICNGLIRS